MENVPPWVVYLAAMVVASTIVMIMGPALLGGRRRRKRLLTPPPGPRPWPVFGNLNLIGALPHRSIHELSKKYGPIMQIHLGCQRVVIGSSVEMAKQFLKTHDAVFADRPRNAAGKYIGFDYQDITWSSYGPYWRQARRLCLTELFSARRLDSYEYIRVEELCRLVSDISAAAGRTINLKDHLSTLSLNVISRMVLGRVYTEEPTAAEETVAAATVASPDEIKKMMDEMFLLNGVMNIGDVIPWLDFLDLQGYVHRMKAVARKFDTFLEHVLDDHNERRRRLGEEFVPRDMVDVLLQLADDPNLDVKLSRDGVKAFTQDLIGGAIETTPVTVEWAMSELLRRPRILEKAAEELDRVVGRGRWVEEKDVQRLPYVEAIAKETMRLHPVGPILTPRCSRQDCNIAGYDIPAGTQVLVNVWTISRDPAVWDDPEEFRPERFFEGRAVDVRGHDFELLPFGAGRRMCPGYPLGLKVIQASLANLLHGFEWRLPEGTPPEDLNMEEIFGLSTHRKFPLEVVAQPRLPPHLYRRRLSSDKRTWVM